MHGETIKLPVELIYK